MWSNSSPIRKPSAATGWPGSRPPPLNSSHASTTRSWPTAKVQSGRSTPDGRRYSTIYLEATDNAQRSVSKKINAILDRISQENQIAVVREIANTFEEDTYPAILDQLAASPRTSNADSDDTPAPAPIKKQTVSVRTITVAGARSVLETEEDIDRYLAALRTALVQALNDDKRIAL